MHKNRLRITYFILVSFFLICIIKTFLLTLDRQSYKGSIKRQSQKIETILNSASPIISSDNKLVSNTVKTYSLALYKPELKMLPVEVDKLLQQDFIYQSDSEKIVKFWENPKQNWLELKSNLDSRIIAKYQNISGFNITQNIQRKFYFDQPIYKNIYQYYQRQIGDTPNYSWYSQDANGNTLYRPNNFSTQESTPETLKISIDTKIQEELTQSLNNGVNKFQASSAMGIILETKTGAILAADYINYLSHDNRISFAQDVFEPGSIFKPITVAIALETGAITKNHICSICNHPLKISGATISNWDNELYPNSNLSDILKNSDNIALSEIGQRIGPEKFKKYRELLNLSEKLQTDLPALSRPLLKEKLSRLDLATNSFGQGIAMSQLQVLAGINAIANNGLWVEPHVNLKIPVRKVQVFSPTTVQNIREVLRYATDNGKANQFKQDYMDICGKSGTAQIAVSGTYENSKTNASYVGYFPCNDPKYTMIITITEPRSSPWGATTAAPVWYEIAKKIYPHL